MRKGRDSCKSKSRWPSGCSSAHRIKLVELVMSSVESGHGDGRGVESKYLKRGRECGLCSRLEDCMPSRAVCATGSLWIQRLSSKAASFCYGQTCDLKVALAERDVSWPAMTFGQSDIQGASLSLGSRVIRAASCKNVWRSYESCSMIQKRMRRPYANEQQRLAQNGGLTVAAPDVLGAMVCVAPPCCVDLRGLGCVREGWPISTCADSCDELRGQVLLSLLDSPVVSSREVSTSRGSYVVCRDGCISDAPTRFDPIGQERMARPSRVTSVLSSFRVPPGFPVSCLICSPSCPSLATSVGAIRLPLVSNRGSDNASVVYVAQRGVYGGNYVNSRRQPKVKCILNRV
jgi:hypothetical protein